MDINNMKIHHIGIILSVSAFDACYKQYLKLFESMHIGEQWIFKNVEEFSCYCYMYGQVEYVVPYGGKLEKYLGENKPGLHHVAFEVADVERTSMELKEKGFILVCNKPVRGVGDLLVNFVHPLETPHVLFEIVEVTK